MNGRCDSQSQLQVQTSQLEPCGFNKNQASRKFDISDLHILHVRQKRDCASFCRTHCCCYGPCLADSILEKRSFCVAKVTFMGFQTMVAKGQAILIGGNSVLD